jgi:predicted Ser/Thr protein kinase
MVGDVIAGRYELEETVGSGGMSSVYKAHDRMLERYVALKVLHPQFGDDEEYVERFRREARAVAKLQHPNIVTVIDRGRSDGAQFIVFEYVDGRSLKELVEDDGPLPVHRAVQFTLQVAEALAFAHQHGIVHRDVKPQNVLVNASDEAKVTDFGIARSLDVERGVTQTGTVLGTSNYLSPEQASGRPVTPATDIYSLGVVLYELLTGEVPFTGQNLVAVAMQHVHEPPPSVLARRPDVPPRLAAAIEKALEKDPADRFVSMDAFAAELRRCLDDVGSFDRERTVVRPPGPVLRERRPQRARTRGGRLPAVLATLGLLAAVGAVVALLVTSGGNKPGAAGGSAAGAARLSATGNYDPSGPPDTHAATAPKATDGNRTTYWETQTYATPAFGNLKHGLGLLLDAGSARKLTALTIATDTPGFQASVLAGSSPTTLAPDSATETVSDGTTITLRGATARYYALWITSLPPGHKAKVNEVTAR